MGTNQSSATATDAGERLDVWLAGQLPYSRSAIQKLIKSGKVLVNGKPEKPSLRLEAGMAVTWEQPEPVDPDLLPEPLDLTIMHADDDIIVIDKPSGLVVHPGSGRSAGTLAAGLLDRYPEIAGIGGPGRPGIVHRLDKDTSGVIVAARSPRAYTSLTGQFADRTVSKTYRAVCHGTIADDQLRLELPIGRSRRNRKRMSIKTESGREAVTELTVLARSPGHTLLQLFPRTGRTHQLRVHLNYIGHPIAGDSIYGHKRRRRVARGSDAQRLLLHAETISFEHPNGSGPVTFSSPAPADFQGEWERLRDEQ